MGSRTTIKSELLAFGLVTSGLLSRALPLIFVDKSSPCIVILGVDFVIIN